MDIPRPDLSQVSPEVLAYIEALEAQLDDAKESSQRPAPAETNEPSETPTPIHLISITGANTAKRTARHHYGRQRRGGMGLFDIDTPTDIPPSLLTLADANDTLVVLTDQGRAYRGLVSDITATEIHAKGASLANVVPLRHGEHVVAAVPADAGDHLVILGEKGWVSTMRASFLGRSMIQGVRVFDCEKNGAVTGAVWYREGSDILIATQNGLGIRFPAARIPRTGCLGIRLDKDDRANAVCESVNDDSTVFVLGFDGKGTLRSMDGFRGNKSPGGGGKVLLKTDRLVGVVAASLTDDLFIISQTGKLIRFSASEIPVKTGVVQGVNCMALRNDECTAVTVASL